MNDLVVDRGPNPYLSNLIVYCNEREMTSVQGDGEWHYRVITIVHEVLLGGGWGVVERP